MKLYSLTPNPALDLSGHVKELVPNEKNYVFDQRKDPGGNGINAARIAHRLGVPVLALGFQGGAAGKEIKDLLEKEGVKTRFTPIGDTTRTNVTVTNGATHQQTRLTFPGPKVSVSEIQALKRNIEKIKSPGIFVLGGSTPQGCKETFHREIGEKAANNGLELVVDVPAKFLSAALGLKKAKALLVKPNQVELEEWAKRKLPQEKDLIEAAKELAKLSTLVCVSLGEKGALLISPYGILKGIAPQIKAKGTVGAGDSMVGAMTAAMIKQKMKLSEDGIQEVLKWGLAAGAATAMSSGTSLGSAIEIRKLYGQVKVERLLI